MPSGKMLFRTRIFAFGSYRIHDMSSSLKLYRTGMLYRLKIGT